MKSRHAAALALVGWYLIVPPMRYDTHKGLWVDFKAQTTDWSIMKEFDHQKDCSDGLRNHGYRLAEEAGRFGTHQAKELYRQAFSKAQCIASDSFLPKGGFIGRIRQGSEIPSDATN